MIKLRVRAWFQGRSSSRSQDISQRGHFGYPLGSIWAFWNRNEIITPNHFYGSGIAAYLGLEHGFRVVSLFFRFQDIGQKGHFGCPLGSIWAFWDLKEIRTPKHFFGSGMVAFMGVEHGFRVVSLFVTKMTILSAWAKFGHFGNWAPKHFYRSGIEVV